MFMNNFQWDEKPPVFDVPDGEHKVKIVKVFDASTQSGKPYTGFLLKVEGGNIGYTHSVYYGNEYTNRNWTSFLLAFRIQPPPTTDDWANYYGMWEGLEGKAMFHHKEETFTDRMGVQRTVNKCELHYFVAPPKEAGTARGNVVVPPPVTAKPSAPAPAAQTAKPAAPAMPPQYGGGQGGQQGGKAASLKNPDGFPEDIPFELY
jgi:hypothetical protein